MDGCFKYELLILSEGTILSKSLDCNGVVLECLEDVAGVGNIPGSVLLNGAKVSLGEEIFSSDDVFLHHFAKENVIDLDVMCRNPVVEERWWEHHVVSIEPEFSSILGVEHVGVS